MDSAVSCCGVSCGHRSAEVKQKINKLLMDIFTHCNFMPARQDVDPYIKHFYGETDVIEDSPPQVT